jgi:hypothetical protein
MWRRRRWRRRRRGRRRRRRGSRVESASITRGYACGWDYGMRIAKGRVCV